MSEFKTHHLVVELLNILGSNAPPEDFLKLINNDINSQPSNSIMRAQNVHIQEIAKQSPNSEGFLDKYEELLEKNVDSLGPFVEVLYQLSKDNTLKKILRKTNYKTTLQKHSEKGCGKVTKQDLPNLKSKLYEAVANEKNVNSKISLCKKESLAKSISPSMLNWVQKRPSMSWDFSSESFQQIHQLIAPIPSTTQEHLLIEDLLYVLMGVEGCMIEPQPINDIYDPREFTIRSDIDTSLHDLVRFILPLASHYSILQRFIEEKVGFEYGQVNHALVAAMSGMIKDYLLFTCQLESEHRNGNLTLQKMFFYVQRNMLSMGVMAGMASTIGKANARGGKVLSLLHEHSLLHLADTKAHELCMFLSQKAAKPYMQMLSTWIYTGIINDPFKEFLVEDNQLQSKAAEPVSYADDFWEKRYSVRRERVPIFLEKFSDVILRTGKYLNVVRQCGKPIDYRAEEIIYTPREPKIVETIDFAYFAASKMLRELLMDEYDLLGRLRSVKHYFLLDQGDFIVQFMDLCEKELSKDVKKVVVPRLESLFELALRLSMANNDLYKDDMRIELLQYDLQFQMFKILSIHTEEEQEYRIPVMKPTLTGLESFSFGYEVKWPISLVLNRRAIACYQMIFRHLFFCKHVERLICRVWICNKEAKTFGQAEAKQYRAAFTLRQRMLNCVQNLEYHMMVEVIEPNWQSFRERVAKVVDVDEILKCHNDFLDMCLKDCMLTSPGLLRTVTKLLNVCVEFCSFIQRMQRYYVDAELSSMISSAHEATELLCQSPEHSFSASMCNSMSASIFGGDFSGAGGENIEEATITDSESFEQSIKRFDVQFSGVLLTLMDRINELGRKNSNDKLVNLLYRIDFNSFYSAQLENFVLQKNDTSG